MIQNYKPEDIGKYPHFAFSCFAHRFFSFVHFWFVECAQRIRYTLKKWLACYTYTHYVYLLYIYYSLFCWFIFIIFGFFVFNFISLLCLYGYMFLWIEIYKQNNIHIYITYIKRSLAHHTHIYFLVEPIITTYIFSVLYIKYIYLSSWSFYSLGISSILCIYKHHKKKLFNWIAISY